MPPKSYLSSPPVTGGVLLSCLLLTGCATEKAITEQTQPLRDQTVRLEQAMAESREAASRAVQEQSTAALARQSVLGKQLADVQAGIQSMQGKLQAQDERATRTELRVDELAATLSGRLTQAEQRLNDTAAAEQQAANQVQAIKQKQDADAAASAALAERLAQAEQRLNDTATAGQQAANQVQAIKEKQAADAAASAALAGRLAQAEQRLNDTAAVGQQAANQVRAVKEKQDADVAASAALAGRLAQAERRLNDLSGSVKEAMALAVQENILAHGKETFTVSLTEDKTMYPLNSPELGSQDTAKLDDLAGRLAKLDQEYHLDIQGHTDDIGSEDYKYNLGKARADVVKRYLSEKKGVSLNRMSVISYGADKPLSPAGNHNRRIFIRVLVLK